MSDQGAEDPDTDKDSPEHALPPEDLAYPTLHFEDGDIDADGSFALATALDYDDMAAWAEGLAGALTSHDLGVSTPDGLVTFGVAPEGVDAAFTADDDHRGTLKVTFRLSAKTMMVTDDPADAVGARGDMGFVPLSMLTDDREQYRCYNWIDDPTDPE